MPKPRRKPATNSTVVVEAKPWQQSRAIWLGVLSVVVPIVTYAADNALALGLPDKAIPWIALFVFAAGSIRQRFETTQPIGKAGELVPVDGSALGAPDDDQTSRKFEALAAALGAQHNDIERLENALLDLRADTRRDGPEPEDPPFLFPDAPVNTSTTTSERFRG